MEGKAVLIVCASKKKTRQINYSVSEEEEKLMYVYSS